MLSHKGVTLQLVILAFTFFQNRLNEILVNLLEIQIVFEALLGDAFLFY